MNLLKQLLVKEERQSIEIKSTSNMQIKPDNQTKPLICSRSQSFVQKNSIIFMNKHTHAQTINFKFPILGWQILVKFYGLYILSVSASIFDFIPKIDWLDCWQFIEICGYMS